MIYICCFAVIFSIKKIKIVSLFAHCTVTAVTATFLKQHNISKIQ